MIHCLSKWLSLPLINGLILIGYILMVLNKPTWMRSLQTALKNELSCFKLNSDVLIIRNADLWIKIFLYNFSSEVREGSPCGLWKKPHSHLRRSESSSDELHLRPIGILTPVSVIASRAAQGKVFASGGNSEGQLGLGDCEERTAFQRIRAFDSHGPIRMLAAGSNTSAALTGDWLFFFILWAYNVLF